MTILEAMAREEGFYVSGTRAQRNNNPGNIEYGKFTRSHGAVGSDGRFAIFATPEAGFAAMRALLSSAYKGMTVEEALNHYAPPVENNTNSYVNNICEWARMKPTDVIDQYLAA